MGPSDRGGSATRDGSAPEAGGQPEPAVPASPGPLPNASEASLPGPWRRALEEILDAVHDPGTSVVDVVGPRGSGRSTVLRHVTRALAATGRQLVVGGPRDRSWRRLLGQPEPSATPAALDGSRGGLDDRASVERPAGLVVDDADQLDDHTAGELRAAVARGCLVVLSVLEGADGPPALAAMRRAPGTATVRIDPFTVLDVLALLEGLLGGPVDSMAAAHVYRDTGGRAALVAEVCRQGLAAGALRRGQHGRYVLEAEPPTPWKLTVAGASEAVPPDRLQVLRLLAVAGGPLDRALVEGLTSASTVAEVIESGAVTSSSRAGRQRIGHTYPWVASGLRAGLPDELRRQLLRRLAEEALPVDHLDDVDRLAAVRWLVAADAGEPLDAVHEDAVRLARRYGDRRLATALRRLAGSQGGPGGQETTLDLLDRGRLGDGPADRGRPQEGQGRSASVQPDHDVVIDAYRAYLGPPTESDAQPPVLPRAAGGQRVTGPAASLEALRGILLLADGRVDDALGTSSRVSLDQVETMTIRLASLIRAGRPADAVRLARGRLRSLDLGSTWYGSFRHVVYGHARLASAYAGGHEAARDYARRQYEAALLDDQPVAASTWAFVLGDIELLIRGDLPAATTALRGAAELMAETESGMGPAGHVICLGELATAQVLGGDVESARRTLATVGEVWPAPVHFGEVDVACGLVTHADGDPDGAASHLLGAVRRARTHGGWLDAAWTGVFAARLGYARPAAQLLAGAARESQGPVLRAMLDTVKALASGSQAERERMSGHHTDGGFTLLAGLLGRAGERTAPGLAQIPTSAVTGEPEGPGPRHRRGAVDPAAAAETSAAASPPVALTRRQREVAQLVAAGLTNTEVADRLQLSRRTVEVHLQLVYDKLGVHRRRELRPVLQARGLPVDDPT